MFLHVTTATYLEGYKVRLSFNDGAEGEIDLSSELYGEIFEPLKDLSFSNRSPWKVIPCRGVMEQTLLLSFSVKISPNKALKRTPTMLPFIIAGIALALMHKCYLSV